MKCVECPLALSCHAGHLGYTFLCPTCGKFVVTRQEDITPIYALFCEQRPLTPAIKQTWKDYAKNCAGLNLMVEDDGPGGLADTWFNDVNKLRLSECSLCADVFHILAQAGAVWRDLDEEAQLRKETQRHAFGLRGTRRGE